MMNINYLTQFFFSMMGILFFTQQGHTSSASASVMNPNSCYTIFFAPVGVPESLANAQKGEFVALSSEPNNDGFKERAMILGFGNELIGPQKNDEAIITFGRLETAAPIVVLFLNDGSYVKGLVVGSNIIETYGDSNNVPAKVSIRAIKKGSKDEIQEIQIQNIYAFGLYSRDFSEIESKIPKPEVNPVIKRQQEFNQLARGLNPAEREMLFRLKTIAARSESDRKFILVSYSRDRRKIQKQTIVNLISVKDQEYSVGNTIKRYFTITLDPEIKIGSEINQTVEMDLMDFVNGNYSLEPLDYNFVDRKIEESKKYEHVYRLINERRVGTVNIHFHPAYKYPERPNGVNFVVADGQSLMARGDSNGLTWVHFKDTRGNPHKALLQAILLIN